MISLSAILDWAQEVGLYFYISMILLAYHYWRERRGEGDGAYKKQCRWDKENDPYYDLS